MADVKSYIRTVVGESGRRLRFLACKAKGGFSCYAQNQQVTKVGKKSTTQTIARGASSKVTTYAEGVSWVDAATAKAVAAGWTLPVTKAKGFVATEDAFTLDTLPAPKAVVEAPAETPAPEAPAPSEEAPAPAPEAPAPVEPPAKGGRKK